MDTRNNSKKTLRLLFFLFLALLVTAASAAVYTYMYMQASPISVKAAKVVFADGTDAAVAGESVGTNGTYVQFNSLSGWPNATRVYENATVIKKIDPSVNFPCQLQCDSWSGNTGSLSQLYVKVYNAAGTWQGTLDVGAANTTSFTIPHGEVWRVEWVIKWSATALSTDTITVTLALTVTGEGTGE